MSGDLGPGSYTTQAQCCCEETKHEQHRHSKPPKHSQCLKYHFTGSEDCESLASPPTGPVSAPSTLGTYDPKTCRTGEPNAFFDYTQGACCERYGLLPSANDPRAEVCGPAERRRHHKPTVTISPTADVSDSSQIHSSNKGGKGGKGYDGGKGSKGYDGSKGSKGYDDGKGSKGYDGGKGSKSYDGSKGRKGYDGGKGSTGYDGSKGYDDGKGSKGYDGGNGSTGYEGGKGIKGYDGGKTQSSMQPPRFQPSQPSHFSQESHAGRASRFAESYLRD